MRKISLFNKTSLGPGSLDRCRKKMHTGVVPDKVHLLTSHLKDFTGFAKLKYSDREFQSQRDPEWIILPPHSWPAASKDQSSLPLQSFKNSYRGQDLRFKGSSSSASKCMKQKKKSDMQIKEISANSSRLIKRALNMRWTPAGRLEACGDSVPSCGSLLAGSVDVTDELSDAPRSSHPCVFASSRAGSTGWLGKVTGSHDTSGEMERWNGVNGLNLL